jgi:uncharacterized protein YjbI with pentapeptide repeats
VTPPYYNVDYDEQRRGGTLVANDEHVAKLKEGVRAWNTWRKARPKVVPDLSGANFVGAKLRKVNLRLVELRKADFMEADLREANLSNAGLSLAMLVSANLAGANLSSADGNYADFSYASLKCVDLSNAALIGANFRWTNLSGASLVGADCNLTNLQGANLSDADLESITLAGAVFGDNDLSTVVGLGKVDHNGPSTIGIDVIYRSQGKIPVAFLRGCGVPENFITYAQSLVANPVEFYSCFISYSTKDQDFADRLYADLQNIRACVAGLPRMTSRAARSFTSR